MKKIKIEFETENSAFDTDINIELTMVLSQVKHIVMMYNKELSNNQIFKLKDINGNTIGKVTIK